MSIDILSNLQAMQEEPELPMRVDLQQTLASTEDAEMVDIEYWLDGEHDVWFEEPAAGGGVRRTKDGQARREKIAGVGTPLRHRLKLVLGPGAAAERVVVHQDLTDPVGPKIRDFDQVAIPIKR